MNKPQPGAKKIKETIETHLLIEGVHQSIDIAYALEKLKDRQDKGATHFEVEHDEITEYDSLVFYRLRWETPEETQTRQNKILDTIAEEKEMLKKLKAKYPDL